MPSIGGSAESLSLDSRPYAVTTDATIMRDLGGYHNSKESNGDGSGRTLKKRMLWKLTGVVVDTDDTLGDQEELQALADGVRDFPITITYVSGKTYQGTGQIVGGIEFDHQTATAKFDLSGGGKLTAQ